MDSGVDAFERGEWRVAREALASAAQAGSLEAPGLWRLAVASFLRGDEAGFLAALEEAHRTYLEDGSCDEAVRCAVWLGIHLASRGEMAKASGWFGRATRLLDDVDEDSPARGWALIPRGHGELAADPESSARTAAAAVDIGRRADDADLLTVALHLRGRALLRAGKVEEGLALLDEAMVAVTADRLSPMVTGLVYCSVIGACREVLALARAQEWTSALADWCASQPDMVAYTGECRVYRSEILLRRGRWDEAIREARDAAERLEEHPGAVSAGTAHYVVGEVHRLRGENEAAEAAFHAAARTGAPPHPGLALLRLQEGDVQAAMGVLRRALAETPGRAKRVRLLPAQVEVLLASGDVGGAELAAEELADSASSCARTIAETLVAEARGAVLLASGDAAAAIAPLRSAWRRWRTVGAPYEAARVRLRVARACLALGDAEGAVLEHDAARETLEGLGVTPILASLGGTPEAPDRVAAVEDHGLTPRERDVIEVVATGASNRAIARKLSISEKTVARHLSNIYRKLGLSSRSAATAFAYEHGLVEPSA